MPNPKLRFIADCPIETLKPYEHNPRNNDHAVEAVARSMEAFGFVSPIIANEDYEICSGHTRYKAALSRGDKTAPVIIAPQLVGDKFKGFNIADNKTAEIAEWDEAELARLVSEIQGGDIDVASLGFNAEEFNAIMASLDETPEYLKDFDDIPDPPPEAITKTGDLWILGNHRLLCGDATKVEDVARLMDGEKASMVFTDPPYAVNYGADQDTLNAKSGGKFGPKVRPIVNDDLTPNECATELWLPAFTVMYDVAWDDCSLYMTMCQGGDQMMMMMMMRDAGWQVKHELIWVKNAPVFSMGRLNYDYKHEPILFGWKKKHKFYGKGEFLNSIWEVDKTYKADLHPTMKPVRLIKNALLNSSLSGDICIDFFLGSGSTMIACEETGRICYGMEIAPIYCDVSVRRWEELTGKKAELIPASGGAHAAN